MPSHTTHSDTGCCCGDICQRPGCALYGAGGICGEHGIYDGVRCPGCRSEEQEAARTAQEDQWRRGMERFGWI